MLLVVQVTERTPSNRAKAHVSLTLAAATMREALAIAPVLLIASFDTTRPHAAVQVAKAIALRALLTAFVHAALAATVSATETPALGRLAAARKAASGTPSMAFTESIGLGSLVTAVHATWFALDPPTVLIQERAGFPNTRTRTGHTREAAKRSLLVHECSEGLRSWQLIQLLLETSRRREVEAEG